MFMSSFERWILHHQSDKPVTYTRMRIHFCHVEKELEIVPLAIDFREVDESLESRYSDIYKTILNAIIRKVQTLATTIFFISESTILVNKFFF